MGLLLDAIDDHLHSGGDALARRQAWVESERELPLERLHADVDDSFDLPAARHDL
jgi:hypothetical protein